MSVCPQCGAEYRSGQHFCSQCGAALPEATSGAPACPSCGAAVKASQKFCHECGQALQGGLTPPRPQGSQRLIALGILAILVLVALVVVINLFRKAPLPPPEARLSQPPAASAPSPASPPPPPEATASKPSKTSLENELEDILHDLRQANLNKDIVLYMSRYSSLYPELDKKREATLKTWENHDFKNLAFNLSKIRSLGPDDAVAEVSWSILVYNKAKKKTETSDYTYQVWFSRELGRWKIKKVEDLSS